MTTSVVEPGTPMEPRAGRSALSRWLTDLFTMEIVLGTLSLVVLTVLWEYAKPLDIPFLRNLPSLSEVGAAARKLMPTQIYLDSWQASVGRIVSGFLLAQAVGVPVGLMMAINRASFETFFPIVEILRPIPPVAWIPISIVFWPTREMSVIFIIFLGAFWIVVLNTIGGASNIDPNYKRAALSLGSKPGHLFWYIILPATLPSIITGMTVGIGIAWEMVVAAEMVAGRNGLGYLLWQSFEINAIAQCFVCIISIGLAGFVSSQLIRVVGRHITPWQRRR